MIRTESIRSLSDFRKNATSHLDRLARTGGVDVLTVNGQAKGVVMSPALFDRLAEYARQAEVAEAIQRGLDEIESGKGVDARTGLLRLAKEMGIRPGT